MLAFHIRRIYMKKWDALLVDKFTFAEMTMVVSLNLCFLLMILQSIWVQNMVSILREPAGLRASETREPGSKIESQWLAGSL